MYGREAGARLRSRICLRPTNGALISVGNWNHAHPIRIGTHVRSCRKTRIAPRRRSQPDGAPPDKSRSRTFPTPVPFPDPSSISNQTQCLPASESDNDRRTQQRSHLPLRARSHGPPHKYNPNAPPVLPSAPTPPLCTRPTTR